MAVLMETCERRGTDVDETTCQLGHMVVDSTYCKAVNDLNMPIT